MTTHNFQQFSRAFNKMIRDVCHASINPQVFRHPLIIQFSAIFQEIFFEPGDDTSVNVKFVIYILKLKYKGVGIHDSLRLNTSILVRKEDDPTESEGTTMSIIWVVKALNCIKEPEVCVMICEARCEGNSTAISCSHINFGSSHWRSYGVA